VEVRGRGCIHCNDRMQQDATSVNKELIDRIGKRKGGGWRSQKLFPWSPWQRG
jgi:hypothetical protein